MPTRGAIRSSLPLCILLCIVSGLAPAPLYAATCEPGLRQIEFDHTSNKPKDPGVVSLAAGERFQIKIANTYPTCFEFSYRTIDLPPDPRAAPGTFEKTDYCFEPIVHDGKSRDYLVFLTPRPEYNPLPPGCKLSVHGQGDPWVIPVRTFGWTVGFAGGFTIDGLTSPSYALIPSERTKGDSTEQGFKVIRQPEREDNYTLGAAAMVHLFHTDRNKFGKTPWAPLTFGLAVNNGSNVRYSLGTSLRFSDQAFLTLGLVFGGRARLPPGLDLQENNFTTDVNKLNALDSRNDVSWFLGVSYAFLGDKAKGILEAAIPTDTGNKQGQGQSTSGKSTSVAQVKLEGRPPKLDFPQASAATGQIGGQRIEIRLSEGAKTTVKLELIGPGSGSFSISPSTCAGLVVGGPSCAVTVTPKPALQAGTYKAALVATPDSGSPLSVEIKLEVTTP